MVWIHQSEPPMRLNHILIVSGLFLAAALPSSALPIISEFMAQNETVLADEDGAFSDWIEIYNPGPGSLDLNGYYLTDEASRRQIASTAHEIVASQHTYVDRAREILAAFASL